MNYEEAMAYQTCGKSMKSWRERDQTWDVWECFNGSPCKDCGPLVDESHRVISKRNDIVEENSTSAPVNNYYGTPYVSYYDDKFLLGVQDYCGEDEVYISKEFYDAWVKEFPIDED